MRYKHIGIVGASLIATLCLLSGLMYYFNQGTIRNSSCTCRRINPPRAEESWRYRDRWLVFCDDIVTKESTNESSLERSKNYAKIEYNSPKILCPRALLDNPRCAIDRECLRRTRAAYSIATLFCVTYAARRSYEIKKTKIRPSRTVARAGIVRLWYTAITLRVEDGKYVFKVANRLCAANCTPRVNLQTEKTLSRSFSNIFLRVSDNCPVGTFLCHNSSVCMPQHSWCDGTPDCPYNDDESTENCCKFLRFWIIVRCVPQHYRQLF